MDEASIPILGYPPFSFLPLNWKKPKKKDAEEDSARKALDYISEASRKNFNFSEVRQEEERYLDQNPRYKKRRSVGNSYDNKRDSFRGDGGRRPSDFRPPPPLNRNTFTQPLERHNSPPQPRDDRHFPGFSQGDRYFLPYVFCFKFISSRDLFVFLGVAHHI